MGEFRGEAVDWRDDLVAALHRQTAARAEIILHVHHDEHVGWADRNRACHCCALSCCKAPAADPPVPAVDARTRAQTA
jgi:hypothetical protein